ADGQPVAKTPNAPYTTRLMLRRPADARRFSGNVIVEIVNSARRYDFPFAWGVSHDFFMENGDAFAFVTLAQANLEGLKAFDPVRYASLSLANPAPEETCSAGRRAAQGWTGEWPAWRAQRAARVHDRVRRSAADVYRGAACPRAAGRRD